MKLSYGEQGFNTSRISKNFVYQFVQKNFN